MIKKASQVAGMVGVEHQMLCLHLRKAQINSKASGIYTESLYPPPRPPRTAVVVLSPAWLGDRIVDRPPATYRAIVLECSGLPSPKRITFCHSMTALRMMRLVSAIDSDSRTYIISNIVHFRAWTGLKCRHQAELICTLERCILD